MRSGALRDRVRIERRTRVANSSYGQKDEWQTIQSGLPAYIQQMSGKEEFNDDMLKGVVTHKVKLRHSTRSEGLTNLDRLVDERHGTIHNVRAVTHDPRRRVLLVMTQTGVRT